MEYYEISRLDVGKSFLFCFGRVWVVANFMGQILPRDVDKRVYLRNGILQVENNTQLEARKVAE